MDTMLLQCSDQINGSNAHEAIDNNTYSTSADIITGMDVYCEEFDLIGKIDIYDREKKLLRERKKHIAQIYDGYVYQLYAQCLAMREMGYEVTHLQLYSMDDNKTYEVSLPEKDENRFRQMQLLIHDMRNLDLACYRQLNGAKCRRCIYEPACDRSAKEDVDA